MLNISFNETQIYAPSVILYTNTQGVNARLEYGTYEAYNDIINYISLFVGGLAFLFAIVSAVLGYKLIGF